MSTERHSIGTLEFVEKGVLLGVLIALMICTVSLTLVVQSEIMAVAKTFTFMESILFVAIMIGSGICIGGVTASICNLVYRVCK